MADTSIAITPGTGTAIDTRTEATNGNHRQVIVIGDPSTNAGVAPVDATAGLKVDLGADNDVTVSGATLTAIQTAVEILDNAIAGTEMQVDVVGALPAGTNNIGDVDVLSVVPGTGATNLGKAEDAAHASGDTGVMSLAVRKDTPSASSGTTGDYEPISTDALGKLWIADNQTEDAAHTTGDRGSFVLAVRTDTAAASSGTTGDYEALHTDSVGALWTRDTATQVDDAAFTPATGRIVPVGLLADETSTDSVDEGDAGIPRMTLDRKQIVTPLAHTNGGATAAKLVSAASTNATSLKASAGQVYAISAFNINAAVRYLKLYNKASAPTVGTDVPVQVYAIPGATTGGGFTLSIPVGMEFTTGIAYALTTGITDADTGAVAASEILVNIVYK